MDKHQKRIAFLSATKDVYVKLGDWKTVQEIEIAIKRQSDLFDRIKRK